MKTMSPKTSAPGRVAARSFAWGVRSTEIDFMRATGAETATEGCNGNCSDCSAIAPFDQPRPKRPARNGGRT